MQNKPKVKIGKMNVTSFITMNYEQRTMNDANKNKAKQTQSCPPPADANSKLARHPCGGRSADPYG